MALPAAEVVARLSAIPEYRKRFEAAFGAAQPSVTMEHVADALAAFERGLVTTGRWDAYLAGDANALAPAEIAGLRVFLNVGCVSCHTGPQVGASMFQTAGVMEAWPDQSDQGRFEITKNPVDKMVFRVPSLKNVAHTAPYFHDGSVLKLEDAIRRMARVQLGVPLDDDEVTALVAFLGALSGDLPTSYIQKPTLPPSSSSKGALMMGSK